MQPAECHGDAHRPAVAIRSGGSLLVGLAPLDLGRQGHRATSEVATRDDRARLGRPYGHGLSTTNEV